MPFCPTCRDEFRPGFTRCPDCDVDLVAELPPLPPVPEPVRWVPVHVGTSFAEVEITRSILSSEEIDSRLDNEHAWNNAIGIPGPAVPLIISVPAAEAARARELLAAVEERRRESREAATPDASKKQPFPWRWVLGVTVALLTLDAHAGLAGQGDAAGSVGISWFVVLFGVLLYLRHRDPTPDSPMSMMLLGFLYGAVPASWGAIFLLDMAKQTMGLKEIEGAYHFLLVGPIEEGMKFLGPLLIVSAVRQWRKRPYAWFLAAAASGAGFGCSENVHYYVTLAPFGNPFDLFLLRSGALYHVILTATVGMIAGIARNRLEAGIGILLMLVFVSLAHGLWNVTAENGLQLLLPVYLFVTVLALRAEVRSLAGRESGRDEGRQEHVTPDTTAGV